MTTDMDDYYYLVGDEDSGTGLHCKKCETAGLPIVYYSPMVASDKTYENTNVVTVYKISDIFLPALVHLDHHKKGLL